MTTKNPLQNKIIVVKSIDKNLAIYSDKKNPNYGGMNENSVRIYRLPYGKSGFVNIFKDKKDEQSFLEAALGLEENTLSTTRVAETNFWSEYNNSELNKVVLRKGSNIINLNEPSGYIKYLILKANSEFICPSREELNTRKKATYEYVIENQGDDLKEMIEDVDPILDCNSLLAKIKDDTDKLAYVCLVLTKKKHDAKEKNNKYFVKTILEYINSNPKYTLSILDDKYLDTKIFINKCVNKGLIVTKSKFYFIREGDVPMCNPGTDSTLEVAAVWLSEYENVAYKQQLELNLQKLTPKK
ncbi:MAG: hypothetical protein LBM96_05775 [Methanobrevibacter sp.]|jgi:hypothetical protein|nr:hypothetical protein [Candidatus Methanoflexus mossambicus]